MKRLIPLYFLIILSIGLFAQSTTPPWGNTNGKAVKYAPTYSLQYITDAASYTDTVMISPSADENWVIINNGDTLQNHLCIGIKDSTSRGRTKYFTDDNLKRGQKLYIAFSTTGLRQDTLDFYGSIQVDSSGSGNAARLNVKKDATKKYYIIPFVCDGAKYIQVTDGNGGNGGSEPSNR